MSYQPPTNYNYGWPDGNQTPGYEQPNDNPAMPPSNYPPVPSAYPPMEAHSPYTQVAALPQQGQRKGLALAGFILSILSAVAFVGIFMGTQNTFEELMWSSAIAFAIIGFILSALARCSVHRKGLATTGLVLSIIMLSLLVGLLLVGLVAMTMISHAPSY